MKYLTIIAVDMHSSDSTNRTFNGEDVEALKSDIEAWEKELPYSRYELSTQELIDDNAIEELLEDLEVEF